MKAVLTLGLAAALAVSVLAQAPAPAAPTGPELKVGDVAPDFTLPGASRYGLVKEPIKLSSLRGQTVVIAFFPKARTKG